MSKIVSPSYNGVAFSCPHCGAHAKQDWFKLSLEAEHAYEHMMYSDVAYCQACSNPSIWFHKKMVYPLLSIAPLPNEEMFEDVKSDYIEASNIVQLSPRGASAILRLALQKLCKHLGEKGEHLDTDIKSLVEKGLNSKLLKAFEIVRVIGNNAVHPGEIRMEDDIDTASKLFLIINIICTDLITNPNEIDSLFQEKMPEKIKKKLE